VSCFDMRAFTFVAYCCFCQYQSEVILVDLKKGHARC
jgi:hypothetical protein